MWLEDLTPLDLYELPIEVLYKQAWKEYKNSGFRDVCYLNGKLGKCVRLRGHIGHHVSWSKPRIEAWTALESRLVELSPRDYGSILTRPDVES